MSNTTIYIRDKYSGTIHEIGTDKHDHLRVDSFGTVHYSNLQNGDGCGAYSHINSKSGYEFVISEYGMLGDCEEMAQYTFNKFIAESKANDPLPDCMWNLADFSLPKDYELVLVEDDTGYRTTDYLVNNKWNKYDCDGQKHKVVKWLKIQRGRNGC